MDEQKVLKFPDRIVIELTGKCNLSCPMCPRHFAAASENFMASELWRRLIDEIFENNPQAIVLPFWRGESLLHPEFCAFMEYALKRGMRIHMCSNVHVITPAQQETLRKLEFVTFSIHTPRGYENAKRFASLPRAKTQICQASFVDCEKTTETCLQEIINDPELGGFDSIRLYVEHTKNGVFGGGTKESGSRIFCPKLSGTLVIASNGEISRCNHQWKTDPSLNVNRMSIAEIWDSEPMKKIRQSYPDAACAACEQWTGHTQGKRWTKNEQGIVCTEF